MPLRIVFAGTPKIAVPTLAALIESKHEVLAVYTQPDRPAGRGKVLTASPVKSLALSHQIPVFQPLSLKESKEYEQLAALKPDVLVVVAYGMILPQTVLDIPSYGCLNCHPSLLPRWRGATPIQSALLAGDAKTGVSIMQLTLQMDAGPILLQKEIDIRPEDTSGSLHVILGTMGSGMMLHALSQLESGSASFSKQNESDVTYCKKIQKSDAKIDWQQSAIDIVNAVRAYNPWPIAFTDFLNDTLRVWRASVINEENTSSPGALIRFDKSGLYFSTKNGVLQITEMQMPGKNVMKAIDFYNAYHTKISINENLK